MRKIHLSLLLSIVAFFATGCPNEPSKSFPDPTPTGYNKSFVNNVNFYLLKVQGDYNQAVANDEGDLAQGIRNDAIEDALGVIDSNYNSYITQLNRRRSAIDFIADVIELSTGAATGIAKGERPNQILGIALTAFRGGRRSSELNFYKEQTVPILITKMDGNRAEVYATILQKKTRPVTQYSMKEAIRDIVAYYNAGTLVRAFTQLSKDTAEQAKQSERNVLQLQNINPADIVRTTPDTRKAANIIGKHLTNFDRTFESGSDSAKEEAKEKLRLIYLDIAKSADFKPILDKVRQAVPSLAPKMDDLENSDINVSRSVSQDDLKEIVFQVFRTIDINTEGTLIVKLKDIFDARF